jgi:hypothetical protein
VKISLYQFQVAHTNFLPFAPNIFLIWPRLPSGGTGTKLYSPGYDMTTMYVGVCWLLMCIHNFSCFILTASLPSLFATFMYGSMSDATGRKPVLLLALCGAFLHYLIVSLTVTLGMQIIFILFINIIYI